LIEQERLLFRAKNEKRQIQRYPAVFSGIQHTLAALKFFIQSWILGDIINLFFQEKRNIIRVIA
jgi:hypothetical protein